MVKLRLLLSIVLIGFLSISNAYAQVSATIDRATIDMGDTIELTISGDDIPNNAAPDLSEIIDNFSLLSSGQTQSVQMYNGKMSKQTVWIFTLSPKHAGVITIPAMTVGNEKTAALKLQVKGDTTTTNTPAATTTTSNRPDVFLKADLTPATPYVRSQVNYRLRLFYNRQIANPQLADPSASGVDFMQIGQSKVYQKEINHQPYQVLEINYAAFPEKSGTLSIPGPVFAASILTDNVNNFMTANTVKPVRVAANSLQMNVLPIPAAMDKSWWLPASEVKLTEEWSMDPSKFTVGVPLTRTVKIKANGVMGAQLPTLLPTNTPGFQMYPDKPDINSSTDGQHIFATRIEKAAYMPTTAGTNVLPAITVKWWNTQTNQLQTATIAARTIQVLPGVNNNLATPIDTSINNKAEKISSKPSATSFVHTSAWAKLHQYPFVMAMIILPWIACLLLSYGWWRDKRKPTPASVSSIEITSQQIQLKQARKNVEHAVKIQDPQQFAKAIIVFAQQVFPESRIITLSDVAAHCRTEAAKSAMQDLDKLRYSFASGVWQAEQTWKIMQHELISKQHDAMNKTNGLPELYP